MIKPILKIEMPNTVDESGAKDILEGLKNTDVTKEYHVIVVRGNQDYVSVEIITASDISIHKA